jgi:hypothetical protein
MRTHLVTSMFHHHSSWSRQQVMKTIEHKTKTKPNAGLLAATTRGFGGCSIHLQVANIGLGRTW